MEKQTIFIFRILFSVISFSLMNALLVEESIDELVEPIIEVLLSNEDKLTSEDESLLCKSINRHSLSTCCMTLFGCIF